MILLVNVPIDFDTGALQGSLGPVGPMGPPGLSAVGLPGRVGPQGTEGPPGPVGLQGQKACLFLHVVVGKLLVN